MLRLIHRDPESGHRIDRSPPKACDSNPTWYLDKPDLARLTVKIMAELALSTYWPPGPIDLVVVQLTASGRMMWPFGVKYLSTVLTAFLCKR